MILQRLAPCLFFCTLLSPCYSQQSNDYKSYRDTLNPIVCGIRDSLTLTQTIQRLEQFDTTGITQNMTVYYNDLSDCYWELAMYEPTEAGKNQKINHTVMNCERALFHSPKNTKALWNVAFASYVLGDCERVHKYLPLYKKYEPRRYWSKAELKSISASCPME